MKYKTIGIVSLLLCFTITLTVIYVGDDKHNRYHQHLERPGYTACTDHGSEKFCTHLPIVMIDTGGKEIPGVPLDDELHDDTEYTMAEDGRSTISCGISIVDHKKGNNHTEDVPTMKLRAEVRVRGNSSRYADKKSYVIRTRKGDDRDQNKDYPILGMPSHHEWALYAPFHDKSLIRNYLCFNMAGEIMEYVPEVRYCEVFINNEYRGLYLMMETIGSGDDCRARLTETDEDVPQTSYIIRLDRGSSNPMKNISTFTQYTMRGPGKKNIVYPRAGSLTPEKIRYIQKDFSDFEKALYSYDFDSYDHGWRAMIDKNNFIDYYLIHEFTGNYDVGGLSTYIYKDLRDKYKMVIWDFDGAFGNFEYEPALYTIKVHSIMWFIMLVKDDEFVDDALQRYWELRDSYFNEEWLYQYIDDTIEWLGPAIQRDNEIWGYRFKDYQILVPHYRNPDDYDDAIRDLKNYIHRRAEWLDDNIEVLRQYCADSKIKKFIEDAN